MDSGTCLAMILAGGQGCRLGALTAHIAKPSVSFGGKYRLIDFVLSNCVNSDIERVGILTQYRAGFLHEYIGTGETWGFDGKRKTLTLLPSIIADNNKSVDAVNCPASYVGTADAVFKNLAFIQEHCPSYVLVLAADQLYQMDYGQLLDAHINSHADVTIAVTTVGAQEAQHLGMLTTNATGQITNFVEKPRDSKGGNASMGIYVFNTDVLVAALQADAVDNGSSHDFGRDVIPALLNQGRRIQAYQFNEYWRDVGTIDSYYKASMSLLDCKETFNPDSPLFPTKSNEAACRPAQVAPTAEVSGSVLAQGCVIHGHVRHSIVSYNARVEEGAVVEDSVLMPGACVQADAHVVRAIIGEQSVVQTGERVGTSDPEADVVLAIAPVFLEECEETQ